MSKIYKDIFQNDYQNEYPISYPSTRHQELSHEHEYQHKQPKIPLHHYQTSLVKPTPSDNEKALPNNKPTLFVNDPTQLGNGKTWVLVDEIFADKRLSVV